METRSAWKALCDGNPPANGSIHKDQSCRELMFSSLLAWMKLLNEQSIWEKRRDPRVTSL